MSALHFKYRPRWVSAENEFCDLEHHTKSMYRSVGYSDLVWTILVTNDGGNHMGSSRQTPEAAAFYLQAAKALWQGVSNTLA